MKTLGLQQIGKTREASAGIGGTGDQVVGFTSCEERVGDSLATKGQRFRQKQTKGRTKDREGGDSLIFYAKRVISNIAR